MGGEVIQSRVYANHTEADIDCVIGVLKKYADTH